MMTMNTRLAALAFGIAVAAVASPAVAQRNNNGVSAARAEALRECSARQQKDLEYLWGVQQDDIYRACMAEHGQPE